MKNPSFARRLALGGLVAATVAGGAIVATASGAAANHVNPQTTETTVRAFTVTLPPWHSVKIPAASCPTGMNLVDQDYSPGRIVPRGVQVNEPGGIGVHINQGSYWTYFEDGYEYNVFTGLSGKDITEATNWDPTTSHTLTIDLHCTTDLSKSYIKEYIVRNP